MQRPSISTFRRLLTVAAVTSLTLTALPDTPVSAAGAVLRVTKVPVQTPVGNSYRGATLSWTLNYSCISVTGSCTATNLVDNLPGGVAVVDANGGSVAGSTITWNLGDLAGGTTASKTISVSVACSTATASYNNHFNGTSSSAPSVTGSSSISVTGASTCLPPPPPAFTKSGPNPINVGGRLNYSLPLAARPLAYTVEDTLPAGIEFLNAFSGNGAIVTTEIACPAWGAVGSCTAPTKVRWNVPAETDARWRLNANGDGDVNWTHGYVKLRVPITYGGASITNNAAETRPSGASTGYDGTAAATGNVVAPGPMANVGKSVDKRPASGTPSGYTPEGRTTKLEDVGYTIRAGNDGNLGAAGADWQAPSITDLLAPETFWDPTEADGNWWQITGGPTTCQAPTFTVTSNYAGTGRTQLKWEFALPCKLGHDMDDNDVITVKFTARTKKGIAANVAINNNASAKADVGTPLITCDSGLTATPSCDASAGFPMPMLGVLDSSKWVNGAADTPATWSRYPDFGQTSVQSFGYATYRLFLRSSANVDTSRIELTDVLPFVGDTAVSEASLPRDSSWRQVLAGPIEVEFLDSASIVTPGTAVNDLTGFTKLVAGTDYNAQFSTGTNPCRIDANNQIKYDATAGPAGCLNDWTTDATLAQAFKIDLTKPIKKYAATPDSGDVLRITVRVKDIGNPTIDLDKIAWNSFAYTATGGGTEFLTAEPIKVGVKMTALPPTRASLGDYVWYDENNNGVQNSFEEGIDGVKVSLYDAGGNLVQTTVTGANPLDASVHGYYRFDGLDPATTYTVKLDRATDYNVGGPLAGFVLSPKDATASGGTDANDSDAALGTDTFAVIAAAPTGAVATHTPTYDFGFWKKPEYSLGNRVWADDDNSGNINGTEAGIDNVVMNLFKKKTDGTFEKVATDTTKNGGYYRFDGLDPNDYYVQIDPSNFAVSGPLEGRRSTSGAAKNSDPNTNIESDDNGLTPATLADYTAAGDRKGIISNVVTLGPGRSEPKDETDLSPSGQGAEDARANMTVDFGVITPKFAVGNYVWIDADRNGIQNTTETGLNGITVTLYRSNGTVAGTTATVNGPDGKPGFYLFDNLVAGDYSAEFSNLPASYRFTTPLGGTDRAADSNAVVTGDPAYTARTAVFTLDETTTTTVVDPTIDGASRIATRVNRTIDAGVYPTFSLGNRVWHDTNANSTVDSGEPGIDGVKVDVYAAGPDGKAVGSPLAPQQTTSNGGYYLFTELTAGDYVVVISKTNFAPGGALSGFFSSGTVGTTETPAADAANGTDNDDNGTLGATGDVVSTKVTLGPTANAPTGEPATPGHADTTPDNQSNVTVDFGFFTISLGNLVWQDTNNNGVRDGAEPALANVKVHIYRDTNGDGIPDGSDVVLPVLTSATGQYLFTGLTPGRYIIELEPPAGYYSSSGTSGSYSGPFEPGKGDNFGADTNDHGTTAGNRIRSATITLSPDTEPLTAVETDDLDSALSNNAIDSNTDLTVDFGLVPGASIGNYVWLDNNRNGIQDEAPDAGIDGVTVKLLDANGNVVKTTVTGADADGRPGYYRFDVIPGTYRVQFDLTTLPSDFVVSPKNKGGDATKDSDGDPTSGLTIATTLDPFENDPTWDLGVYSTAVVVGDYVWYDANNNGLQDDGPDAGAPGVKVTLLDNAGRPVTKDVQGNPIGPKVTDSSGRYLFTNLKPGTYKVRFELPDGYVATRSFAGADDTDSNGVEATSRSLKGGQSDLTLDLGLVRPLAPIFVVPPSTTTTTAPVATTVPGAASPTTAAPATPPGDTGLRPVDPDATKPLPGSIGGTVFFDKDASKKQGGTELGSSGVTVTLYDAAGKVVATTTTDGYGRFSFDAPVGEYTVEITPPSGFRGTTPVRRSYSVKGVTKTAEVGSFGLIDAPSELAFTGGSQTRTVVQVASLILLAGLVLTGRTRRRTR